MAFPSNSQWVTDVNDDFIKTLYTLTETTAEELKQWKPVPPPAVYHNSAEFPENTSFVRYPNNQPPKQPGGYLSVLAQDLDSVVNSARGYNIAITFFKGEKNLQEEVVVAAEPPERLLDGIEFKLFVDPVVTAEGFTHSRELVETWFAKSDRSPDTGRVMEDKTLIPNILVRQMVDEWKQANPGYKEGGFINKKARKSRRKSRNKKNRNRRTKSKSRN
jgi:hypothetical protein